MCVLFTVLLGFDIQKIADTQISKHTIKYKIYTEFQNIRRIGIQ